MTRISLLFATLSSGLALSACAGGDLRDVGDIFSADTATDAIGLPRSEPGEIVIDEGETTVATPYGGAGALASECRAVARDIARLTAVLGPDAIPSNQDAADDEDRASSTEQARDFASDAVSRAPDAATDVARSTIVGLNPARPVVRFLGSASEIEAAARLEREIALKRRAWLRGAFDVQACNPDELNQALDAYNLLLMPLDG